MKVLGISEIDNDAGAALFVDGEPVAAANEERFSRRKMHAGFPHRTVAWLLKHARLRPRELDAVVIAKLEPEAEIAAVHAPLRAHDFWGIDAPFGRRLRNWIAFRGYKMPRNRREIRRHGREIAAWIEAMGIPRDRVHRRDHHRAHAASAFFASGLDRALALTLDGQGGGVTATAWRARGATLEKLGEVKSPNSLGFFYAMVTRALGFRPARHEGKVTGLAACAPPDSEALALFRSLARPVEDGFETPGVYGAIGETRRLAARRGKAAVAAAAQVVLEEVATAWARRWIERSGEKNVVLAGGVFANVKLNQRIREIDGVASVFVFPHMGDGGLGFGAAADFLAEREGRKSRPIRDVFWGPEYSDADCEAALLAAGVEYKHVPELERRLGRWLAQGRIVARFAGRMEFGPRALGNRSILYQATDRTVNDWLNRKLRRTEFMPFAPVTLAADAPLLFEGLACGARAAEFMTMTFTATKALADSAPAVVHVDGTARPQVVHEAANPSLHALLEEYRAASGLPALLNTSFNLHEEPIVMSPADAIRAFLQSGLDLLALGPFLAERKG